MKWISAHWPNLVANRTQYSSCHVNLSASGIYFGSPFGCYPTFHTLTCVGRKQYFQYVKRMFPLFRGKVKFCSVNRLFEYNYSYSRLIYNCMMWTAPSLAAFKMKLKSCLKDQRGWWSKSMLPTYFWLQSPLSFINFLSHMFDYQNNDYQSNSLYVMRKQSGKIWNDLN